MLVPVKAFATAKARLAPALGGREREALVKEMAEGVLRAAGPLPVWVVCDDHAVASWASARGAGVVWTPACGLNRAVHHGVSALADGGATTVIVAHADLPLAVELAPVADFDGVTLVPDRREDGTNVAAVPAGTTFRFSYGPGSFARHVAEAHRLGLPLRVLREPLLSWDVDLPADLVRG
ncbi:MAG: 2-phospho-L-lactate guanylyltransferase [Acidimicrobiales bacterium]